MKKGVFFALGLIVFSIFIYGFAGAQSDDESKAFNDAIVCLDSKTVNSSSLTLEEMVFSVLAGVPDKDLSGKINSKKSGSAECWPSSGCTVRDTALVVLAKKKLGESTNGTMTWLRQQIGMSQDLNWFLQITTANNGPAQCAVNYDGDIDHQITIDEEMKLSGSPGNCLEIDDTGYKLAINSNCIDRTFSVKCEEDFLINLLYKDSSGQVLFVSSETQSGSKGAFLSQEINAKCFKQGGNCEYEGTLWGAAAFYAVDGETSEFAPYLRALANSNERLFPSSFLYYVLQETARGDEQLTKIMENRQTRPVGFYWEAPSSKYGKFYDTSLGMLALSGRDSSVIRDGAFAYLFDNQDDSGCWNNGNIRDTAFIIYSAGWGLRGGDGSGGTGSCGDGIMQKPNANGFNEECDLGVDNGVEGKGCTTECKLVVDAEPPVCGDGNRTGDEACECGEDKVCGNADDELSDNSCGSFGYEGDLSCGADCKEFNYDLCVGEGGPGGGDGPVDPETPTSCQISGNYCVSDRWVCLDKGGQILSEGDFACVSHVEFCCTVPVENENNAKTCFELGGSVCRSDETCSSNPVQASDGSCCLEICRLSGDGGGEDGGGGGDGGGGAEEDSSGNGLTWFIVILAVLILLAVLGILYRNKLRIWWFKRRGKIQSSKTGPSEEPSGMLVSRRPPPRFGPPGVPSRPMPMMPRTPQVNRSITKRNQSERDKDMEETLAKLKKMSE